MQTWQMLQANLLSPPVLAFLLGALAVFLRSDLKVPEPLYASLSIYLLLAIGLRGGHELAGTSLAAFWRPALATLLLGALVPTLAYLVLKATRRFGTADAAALAAHYGSVSAVTFAATLTFLESRGIASEGFMPTLVALLEVPAIIVALVIARVELARTAPAAITLGTGGTAVIAAGPPSSAGVPWAKLLHEVLTSRSVLLMLGGLVVGYLSTPKSVEKVAPLFMNLFYGVLVLFLLELGMLAAQHLRSAFAAKMPGTPRGVMPVLVAFALIMPVINGILGITLAWAAGLSFGGAVVLGVMSASASYIAAPAAVRVALPQANPAYYLTASIGITFPFNLTVGIPLMVAVAKWFYR